MAVTSILGIKTDSTALILMRKALVSLSFILIGIGFIHQRQKQWIGIGIALVLVNVLALIFWATVLIK